MEHLPKSGELYRHFKNKLYQVVTLAVHSETGETLVVYQALYGNYQVYARPLGMFLEEVDHEKYPDAAQKYRFERIDRGALDTEMPQQEKQNSRIQQARHIQKERRAAVQSQESMSLQTDQRMAAQGKESVNLQTDQRMAAQGQGSVNLQTDSVEISENAEGGVSPKLMAFLDTDDLQQKYNILISMRDEVTDHLINNMAVVLDVVIPEGEIDDRYEALKRCIRTKQRYETDRLR